MYKSKIYSNKLPKNIRQPLLKFADNECYLVRKFTDDIGLENRSGNCHANVQSYVNALGGEMVNGWLLSRNKRFREVGLWTWVFHSVWLTDENELLDVTENECYETNTFTTFIPDSTRKVDLNEGISYNNIVIIENEAFAKHYSNSINTDIEVNKIYWVTSDISMVRELSEHNGQYRLLQNQFKNNQKLFLEKYGIAIKNNKLVTTTIANDFFESDAFFDFSISKAA
ncbi:MAG: hypothetical protein KGI88_08100 [Betaproteobacteria bacterium]|nr:hypothetical protein [Betaproteobacteria bacterium]